MATRPRSLSGIRATGKLHIGNYLGALKQFIELQNAGRYDCYFFVADLHAITTPFDPKSLSSNTLEVVAEYLAAGINPDKSIIFLQSHVLQHTQLAWIFNCLLPLSELERQTAFKDKVSQHKKNITAGLLTYPALMAADILLYKPEAVPVGEDQMQHLELARTIARKFNKTFGQTFPEPKTLLQKPLRIMSLKNPSKKMSKTGDEPLYISDTPEVIRDKIKKAVTATDSTHNSPGAQNLLYLMSQFAPPDQYRYFTDQQHAGTLKFSELKAELSQVIADHFSDFRKKKTALLKDKGLIAQVLSNGSHQATQIAEATLAETKKRIGLL